MSITRFTPAVQTKLWQYVDKFMEDYTKPEHNFIHQMLFGILKSGSVQINTISRSLQERISLKKVGKRLGSHLDKADLWYRISESTLKAQKHNLKKCLFIVLDLSDIQKEYAKEMQGLAPVHDGSKDSLAYGYWLCNITAVNKDATTIIPLYSELYSHKEETAGQNEKIIDALELVMKYAAKDAIIVMDRGGDRNVLYEYLLNSGYKFIIRQMGNRNLIHEGNKLCLKDISRKVKLKWSYKAERYKKNKVIHLHYKAGATTVQLQESGQKLWLVVSKEKNRGYTWYLTNIDEDRSKKEVVETVLKGYGVRWKIEEVHRHIKTDYQLESIRLQRYEALKTMNSLLWMAMSFLYTRLEPFVMDILLEPQLALINRKKIKDLLRFVYYKLSFAVKRILSLSKFKYKIKTNVLDTGQLSIPFVYD